MIKQHKHIIILLLVTLFLFPQTLSSYSTHLEDLDPLVDVTLTVDILKIRSLEHDDPQLDVREVIDDHSYPDFYVTIGFTTVDGTISVYNEYSSDIFWNTRYLYNTPFSTTFNVPDDYETVDITIQLWDAADEGATQDRLCDISVDQGSNEDSYDTEITYNIKTGHWTGDDALKDSSGYGRLNGCDDGTIYQPDRDCELWFTIYQNDADGDHIPYDMETNVYGTDPALNDAETDHDQDGVPTGYEWKYGFNPKSYDNHAETDEDNDGLSTTNEYLTSQWYSDPYTRDLFIELDQMEEGPRGEQSLLPELSKEMLYTAHDRQNVIYHLDDGSWAVGETGSEYIPFDPITDFEELREIYNDYFLHGDEENWRREIFHYGIVIYRSNFVEGMAFGANRFQISAGLLEKKVEEHGFDRDVTYASCYMHETGHTLGFWPIPGHNQYGWLLRIFLPLYKSCMSYGWIYRMVDYSDGSRLHLGPFLGDYDDWERMDLTNYKRAW